MSERSALLHGLPCSVRRQFPSKIRVGELKFKFLWGQNEPYAKSRFELRREGDRCWCLQWLCWSLVLSSPSPLPSVPGFSPWAPLSCCWKPVPACFSPSQAAKLVKAAPLVSTPFAPSFLCVQGAAASLWTHGFSGEGTCLLAPPSICPSAFCLGLTPCIQVFRATGHHRMGKDTQCREGNCPHANSWQSLCASGALKMGAKRERNCAWALEQLCIQGRLYP